MPRALQKMQLLRWIILSFVLGKCQGQAPNLRGRAPMDWHPAIAIPPLNGYQQLPPFRPIKEPARTGPKQAVADTSLTHRLQKLPCGAKAWEFRTIDGKCNNVRNTDLGSSNRGQLLHKSNPSSTPTGRNRPNPRLISNIVCAQEEVDKPNHRGMSEFLTYFGQFLDHNIVATPAQVPIERMDIPVARDDATYYTLHANTSTSMHFKRSARAKSYGKPSVINSMSSFLDLAAVYGDNEKRADKLRTKRNGKLKVSKGDNLPFNSDGLMNAPSLSPKMYVAGDFRANEHVALTALHIIWLREHNKLCDSLKRDFPGWGDERLYQMARKINGANFQRVVFEEFYPALTGRRLPPYRGYNKKVDPSISLLFSTAAYRIGHSLVGPDIRRYGCGNTVLPSLKLKDVFFTAPKMMKRHAIEEFMRGMMLTKAQEVDPKATDLIRNFLFSSVKEEDVFDLIAVNIHRGRDHGIPAYNEVRKIMRRKPAKDFAEITPDREMQTRLTRAYGKGNVNNVDAWVGLLAEPHIHGASMGLTMFLIWRQEFLRIRNGDRFFYERPHLFSRKVRGTMYRHGRFKMRDIILRNTKLSPSEFRNPWFSPYARRPPQWKHFQTFHLRGIRRTAKRAINFAGRKSFRSMARDIL